MLQVTYGYNDEIRTCEVNPIKFYQRGKLRLVFEGASFEHKGSWAQYRIILKRNSVYLERAVGNYPDWMFGSSSFKIHSIKHT